MRLCCDACKARDIRRIADENPSYTFECGHVRASDWSLCPFRLTRTDCAWSVSSNSRLAPYSSLLHINTQRARYFHRAAAVSCSPLPSREETFVVEGDYDGEYRCDSEPIGALQGLAPESVIYIGSASKILAPALRLGWALLPAELVQTVADQTRCRSRVTNNGPVGNGTV
jgi:GntR family transcriptional regulator/MocR family aminotransferase